MRIEQDRREALGNVRDAVRAAVSAGADPGVVHAAVDDALGVRPAAPPSLADALRDVLGLPEEKAEAVAAAVRAEIAGAIRQEALHRARADRAAAAAYKEEPDDIRREVRRQLDEAGTQLSEAARREARGL